MNSLPPALTQEDFNELNSQYLAGNPFIDYGTVPKVGEDTSIWIVPFARYVINNTSEYTAARYAGEYLYDRNPGLDNRYPRLDLNGLIAKYCLDPDMGDWNNIFKGYWIEMGNDRAVVELEKVWKSPGEDTWRILDETVATYLHTHFWEAFLHEVAAAYTPEVATAPTSDEVATAPTSGEVTTAQTSDEVAPVQAQALPNLGNYDLRVDYDTGVASGVKSLMAVPGEKLVNLVPAAWDQVEKYKKAPLDSDDINHVAEFQRSAYPPKVGSVHIKLMKLMDYNLANWEGSGASGYNFFFLSPDNELAIIFSGDHYEPYGAMVMGWIAAAYETELQDRVGLLVKHGSSLSSGARRLFGMGGRVQQSSTTYYVDVQGNEDLKPIAKFLWGPKISTRRAIMVRGTSLQPSDWV